MRDAIMKKINLGGYSALLALVLGLSGCYFDNQSYQEANYSSDYSTPKAHGTRHQTANTANQTATGTKAAAKSSASSDPVQKATPGPKRTAAPQLPVIQ